MFSKTGIAGCKQVRALLCARVNLIFKEFKEREEERSHHSKGLQEVFIMARLPMIVIEQRPAQIGINQSHARLRITGNRLRMRVTHNTPEMQLEGDVPRFRVGNRARLNSEMGLSSPSDFSAQKVEAGRAAALRGTRRGAQDGEFLGEVRDLQNRVPRLARMRTMEAIRENVELNVGLMPRSMPQFQWSDSQLRVNWSNANLIIDWEGGHMPEIQVDPPHSVEVYLSSAPYFRVRVEDALPQSAFSQYLDTRG